MKVAKGISALTLVAWVIASHAQAPGESPPAEAPNKAVREAKILKDFPPPGRMIDISGRKLHLLCKGPARGPTVILESGAFGSSVWYWNAQNEVAKVAHACTYDRAGLSWSDPVEGSRTLEARIDDLHALLEKSEVPKPFILAGHSMGGLLVRMYEHKYPNDVAALVLVEASNERANANEESRKRTLQSAGQLTMAINALAAGHPIPQLRIPGAPPEQEIIQRESVFRAGHDDMIAMSNIAEELKSFGDMGNLGSKPLIVITRGKRDPGMSDQQTKEWGESHQWLATISKRSELIVAQNGGHNIMVDRPELYREAVEKVLQMK